MFFAIKAFAAVVYCRVEDRFGNIQVVLLTDKTKVAPVKKLTFPRLELCGATLASRLSKRFVASRVTTIQTNTNISQWRYVSSRDNPADCATRGVQCES